MTEEVWKDIAGWEGLYQVSSEGRVRSLDREITQQGYEGQGVFTRIYKGKVLVGSSTPAGYQTLNLFRSGVQERTQSIHRLVAEAFIPNPNNLPQIDHISRIKTDNRVSNLRWVSAQDNCLNRTPRQGVSGERFITITKKTSYRVKVRDMDAVTYDKSFKTLPEAIIGRNNFLNA